MQRSKKDRFRSPHRTAEQRLRSGDVARLGSLEVYDQLDFRGLHDRQVGRRRALDNFLPSARGPPY
jgi:hypothetical protein